MIGHAMVTPWSHHGHRQFNVNAIIFFCCVTVMIPAYSLNRCYAIFFVAFSVIGKQLLVDRSTDVFDRQAQCLSSRRNLLSDEPADRHHLQPVQGIFAGESHMTELFHSLLQGFILTQDAAAAAPSWKSGRVHEL